MPCGVRCLFRLYVVVCRLLCAGVVVVCLVFVVDCRRVFINVARDAFRVVCCLLVSCAVCCVVRVDCCLVLCVACSLRSVLCCMMFGDCCLVIVV